MEQGLLAEHRRQSGLAQVPLLCWRTALLLGSPPGAYRGSEPICFVSLTTLAA